MSLFTASLRNDRQQETRIKKLGIFTLAQSKRIGVTQQDISRLVAARNLTRVGRGIYLHPDAELDHDVGFQIAGAKFGLETAIGGLSALYHYKLSKQKRNKMQGNSNIFRL